MFDNQYLNAKIKYFTNQNIANFYGKLPEEEYEWI